VPTLLLVVLLLLLPLLRAQSIHCTALCDTAAILMLQ
jgi:hypothetical protein